MMILEDLCGSMRARHWKRSFSHHGALWTTAMKFSARLAYAFSTPDFSLNAISTIQSKCGQRDIGQTGESERNL
jgi:hypothetical protein